MNPMRSTLILISGLTLCSLFASPAIPTPATPLLSPVTTAKANSISRDKLAGEYEWSYNGLLSGQTGQQYGRLSIEFKEGAENVVTIVGLVDYRTGLRDPEATVDFTNGTLSIPNNQVLGSEGSNDIVFYLKSLDASGKLTGGISTSPASIGRITETGIIFPNEDVWAIGLPEAEEAGFYHLTSANELIFINRGDDRMLWEEYCTARFEDGWGVAGLTTDEIASHSWNVSIQKSRTTDGLFRIHNPYMEYQCPLTSDYCGEGDIIFNIHRPDFVWVAPEVESGLLFSGLKLCFTNIEGFNLAQGESVEEIKRTIAAEGGSISNYSNNIVTIHNCRFNYKGAFDRLSFWRDENGESLVPRMTSVIRPTIALSDLQTDMETIEAETEAPVEFYSIDGTRLDQPSGICIRRQGNKVSKIIVR